MNEETKECEDYRVITFVAALAGSGGGFSRITMGGGVFGGVGRSTTKDTADQDENDSIDVRLMTNGGRGGCC